MDRSRQNCYVFCLFLTVTSFLVNKGEYITDGCLALQSIMSLLLQWRCVRVCTVAVEVLTLMGGDSGPSPTVVNASSLTE